MTANFERVPCTVVTGFLGAGKTTLIRILIENVEGKRLALIVNEFGDVGVDGEILKGCGDETCPEENMVELANGCICCTVADEFIPAIERLMALEPRDQGILAYSLRNNKEVKDPAEFFDRIPDVKADPKMVAIAEKIIEQLEGPFDPSEFNDRYEDALRALIEEKKKGKPVKPTKPAAEDDTKVVDLMAALKKSIEGGKPGAKPAGKKVAAKKAAPSRKRA